MVDLSPERQPHAGAHIYAALAFLIYRANEKKLKAARLDLSVTGPLTALKSVHIVDSEGPPSDPSQPEPKAASWCYVPLASTKSIRRFRQNQVRPSSSDKPHFWENQWLMGEKEKHALVRFRTASVVPGY